MDANKRIAIERAVSTMVSDLALNFFRNQGRCDEPLSQKRALDLYLLFQGLRNFLLAYSRTHERPFSAEQKLRLVS